MRCTTAFQQRLANMVATMPRMAHLRKLGADTTPALMHGCETFGISDSALAAARGKVAKAASPDGSGRNPGLALLTIDGTCGTLDPAFAAHAGPIIHWARAVWDTWFPACQMENAFIGATAKLGGARGTLWSVVAGPVTALVATVRRLGWSFDGPWRILTDVGTLIDLRADSPAAAAVQVHEGVRRWRWREAGEAVPGLIPARPDVDGAAPAATDLLVGCFGGVTRLLRGKA